jgi:flagellar basal body-associated protein FliL
MKTSKILLHANKSNNEETPNKVKANKILKSIIIMLLSLIILTSYGCFFGFRGHHHEHHEGHR